jgi:hypothetical protein
MTNLTPAQHLATNTLTYVLGSLAPHVSISLETSPIADVHTIVLTLDEGTTARSDAVSSSVIGSPPEAVPELRDMVVQAAERLCAAYTTQVARRLHNVREAASAAKPRLVISPITMDD